MFDLLFAGFQAYTQIGFFFGALVCLGLGGLVLGSSLYWRVHALHATGTVIGVLPNGNTYERVYRYVLSNGETHEAKSDTGRGWLKGSETGRTVPLLISSHDPGEAREANSYLWEIIGVVIMIPGVIFAYVALTAYPFTAMTWVMAGAMLLYLFERAHRIMIPKGQRLSIAEWKKQHHIGDPTVINMTDVKHAEDLTSSPLALAQQAQRLKAKKWAPLVAVFAVVLAGIGVYQGMKIARLESHGLRAPGEVVRLQEEDSSDSSSYYPIVRYRTDKNVTIEFKDSIGSNPPSHRSGDRVTVLYLSESPNKEAIIDRGMVWNWAIPAFLFLGATLVAWLTVVMSRSGPADRKPLTP